MIKIEPLKGEVGYALVEDGVELIRSTKGISQRAAYQEVKKVKDELEGKVADVQS